MSALPIRELIERKLDELSEEQLSNLLDYLEMMEPTPEADDYDESRDLTIGFIQGPKDVAEHTEEILWAEFALRSDDEPK